MVFRVLQGNLYSTMYSFYIFEDANMWQVLVRADRGVFFFLVSAGGSYSTPAPGRWARPLSIAIIACLRNVLGYFRNNDLGTVAALHH